jgi:peptidoglycan/xylan/chitin deacetylase (PgdA/CDA1 family)
MYHRIADEAFDPWGLAVTPAHFRDQLDWLSQHRTVLPLRAFAELQRRRALPRDAVAVTIDDGYSCSADVAAPLLEQFRIPATIFLPIDLIERRRPFWWDELEELVLGHDGPTLAIDDREIPLGEPTQADRRWSARSPPSSPRQWAFQEILTILTRMKPAKRDDMMDELRHQGARIAEPKSNKWPLSPERTRQIAGDVIEFGSHTRRHPWLTSLNKREQAHEIAGSVDRLQALTGVRPTAFAYPYGVANEESRRQAKAAGFECACVTGDVGVSVFARRFALPRVRVGDWDGAGLEHRLQSVEPA